MRISAVSPAQHRLVVSAERLFGPGHVAACRLQRRQRAMHTQMQHPSPVNSCASMGSAIATEYPHGSETLSAVSMPFSCWVSVHRDVVDVAAVAHNHQDSY